MQSQIHQDLMYLAGRLVHRSAQSECERDAAEFIEGRFKEHTEDVSIEPFHCIENYPYLFASYMSEYLVVGILSLWWPLIAFIYGAIIFVFYLIEFAGFPGLSRFLPQFPSQNVVARFLGTRPRGLVVVTAHYDSGCASPLSAPGVIPWLRTIQNLMLGAMVVVLATCVADFVVTRGGGGTNELSLAIRCGAIAFLLSGSLILFAVASQGEDIRGANSNASGVAAMLQLAGRLAGKPVEDADVWLVATGSHEAWMGGMRRFMEAHRIDRRHTCFLNLEGVGAGQLHYLTREGMLHALQSDPDMVRAAEAVADRYDVKPGAMRAVPTEAHIPLMRDCRAMTVMGLDDEGLPPHWNQISDRVTEVDEKAIARVTDFAEAVIRNLASQQARERLTERD